jgi:ABC-type branched-subunit amino acid transport system substrate-binding protein
MEAKMKKIISLPIMLTLMLSLLMVGCQSGDTIKIGTLLDKTGDLGNYGPPMEVGADLAIKLLTDAGVDIVKVPGDSGTANQKSIAEATRLIDIEGVSAIVGSLSSGVTMATATAVTIPKNIPIMSPASTSPAISTMDDNDTVFRSTVSDAAQGVVLAQFAWDNGIKIAGGLYINNPYGEGLSKMFSDKFTSLGGKISAMVPIEPGQTSYLSEVKKASDGNPDVLLAMTYPVTAQIYIREAIEGGLVSNFMFVDGTKAQDMFDAMTKVHGANYFDGMLGTAPGAKSSPAKNKFEQLYKEANGGKLPTDPFIAETFDAMMMLGLAAFAAQYTDACDSIKSCLRRIATDDGDADPNIEPGDIKTAVNLLKKGNDINYEGAAGSQEIDVNGDVNNTIEVWTIKDGKITSTGKFLSP